MAKAEFYIITFSRVSVNALFPLITILLVVTGCGFQLNRNRIRLPENARSISIDKIVNNSYVPRLNVYLRDLLDGKFVQNSIVVTSAQSADLDLKFNIESMNVTRSDYSLVDNTQTYAYLFSIQGRLTVSHNLKQSTLINNLLVIGSYSLKTEAQDLTSTESDEGRYKAVVDLSDKITAKLTQNF